MNQTRASALCAGFALLAAAPLAAAPAQVSDSLATRTIIAGPQFAKSGFHRFFFGSDYRDLWTTPIQVPVLDLAREAGGLTPVRRVGGRQTKALALKGKDGRNYTFRGLDKDASGVLDEELQGTVVERVLQDQMAAQHPAGELVARGLLDPVDVPCPAWRLVVLPDDPALGDFRADFAGAAGFFGEYPSAVSKTNPGFEGITEIIGHADLYERLNASPHDRIDDRAFLKSRLLDILMGDWDRHRRQWRWAKFPGSALWRPIPEDRDQAFSRYEGVVLAATRRRDPRFQDYGPRYGKIDGLTYNGRDQDRQLLVGLEREDFERSALELKAALTDADLDSAVAMMPREWHALDGPRLFADLRARRDALPEEADRYYLHLAARVDVTLTNLADRAEATRRENGDLDVAVWSAAADSASGEGLSKTDAGSEPYFRRLFRREETGEVRFYALEGDDKVTVIGKGGSMRVYVVGGPGNDTLVARGSGHAKLFDSAGRNAAIGAAFDSKPYAPPPPPESAPWIPPRDWGSVTWSMPWISYGADLGLFLGLVVQNRGFAFRKDPYAHQHTLRAGYAFGEQSGKVAYRGEFRRENRASYWGIHAYASGVEVLRYYGLGNETPDYGDGDTTKVAANEYLFFPSYTAPIGRAEFTIGPGVQYVKTEDNPEELVNIQKPYGVGEFGIVGAYGVLSYDSRDSETFPTRGTFLAARGMFVPEAWDAEAAYGQVNGNANAYASTGRWLTLAARAGGKRVFGTYPYMDAATIGGAGLGVGPLQEPDFTVRSLHSRRFAGDASLWGNAEARIRVSRITIVLPAHWGIFGFGDVGRVWLDGEGSKQWHPGGGGGVWISYLNYRGTFTAGLALGDEGSLFYFRGGFTY